MFKYMSGIITNKGHKSIIVNGVGNHVHILVGLKPTLTISDLVRDVKNNSSNFINAKNWLPGKFSWQEGYGGFSYAHSQLDDVYKYILTQEEHHRRRTFKEEYLDLLEKFGIHYDKRFLFDWD